MYRNVNVKKYTQKASKKDRRRRAKVR